MTTSHSEWARGWSTVLGSVGGMMIGGASTSILGFVMAPLTAEFGWTRAQISTSVLILAVCALIGAPICGASIRRHGPRTVALIGLGASSVGLVLIGLSGPSVWTWYAVWIAYGLLSVAIGPIVWTSAISNIFDRGRGLALSIAMCGSGLAFTLLPPLIAPVLENFGWRGVYFALAILVALVLPINWLALPKRSGAPRFRAPASSDRVMPPWGLTFGEALRTRHFWQLVAGLVAIAAVNGSLVIHFLPILSENGIALDQASFLTACIGPSMIVGKLLTGYLMDRLHAPAVWAVMAALAIVTCLGMWLGKDLLIFALVAAITLGVSTGAAACAMAFVVGRYFGLKDYATIFGILMAAFGIGFGLTPVIVGHVFDVTGSYQPLFPIFMILLSPAVLLIATLGRFPEGSTLPAR